MSVRDWLIQTVRYYREIDFFERYSNLSDQEVADALEALCRADEEYTGGAFGGRGDWEVICYDRQRILGVSLDALYGNDPGGYRFEDAVKTLQVGHPG